MRTNKWINRQAWKEAREAGEQKRREATRQGGMRSYRRRAGDITVVQWWPVEEAVPDGWRIARQEKSHHSRYSMLIEKISE